MVVVCCALFPCCSSVDGEVARVCAHRYTHTPNICQDSRHSQNQFHVQQTRTSGQMVYHQLTIAKEQTRTRRTVTQIQTPVHGIVKRVYTRQGVKTTNDDPPFEASRIVRSKIVANDGSHFFSVKVAPCNPDSISIRPTPIGAGRRGSKQRTSTEPLVELQREIAVDGSGRPLYVQIPRRRYPYLRLAASVTGVPAKEESERFRTISSPAASYDFHADGQPVQLQQSVSPLRRASLSDVEARL